MRSLRDRRTGQWSKDVVSFGVGAIGGLGIGLLIARALRDRVGLGEELREQARRVGSRLRPGRLRRLGPEQAQLDRLEDSVLEAFLDDEILRERGVDIGAISVGIIELSGTVRGEEEAQRAVALANRIPGVRTVVNRLEFEGADGGLLRRRLDDDERSATFAHHEGRVGGMGRRRQSPATDPDRPDDSQKLREEALAAADRDQVADEGLTGRAARQPEEDAEEALGRVGFAEDELDNQDPHGKHAPTTLDDQPQRLRSGSRVGEAPKPGVQRALDQSDTPIDQPSTRDHEA